MSDFRRLIHTSSQAFANHYFLRTPGEGLQFKQVPAAIDRVSGNLIDRGIGLGDRVGLVTENSIETIIAVLALINIGAVVSPVSVRYPQLMIETIARKLSLKAIATDRPDHLPEKMPTISVKEISMQECDFNSEPKRSDDPNRIATVMLTSGSTAASKGVAHSFTQHYYNAAGANRNIPFEPGDRWLLSLPLYHVGGLAVIFRALLGGGTVIIPEQSQSLEGNIKRFGITHLSVVNTQLRQILKSDSVPGAFDSLKAVIVGGGPQDVHLLDQARSAGFPVATTYGLTEMGSMVTCSKPSATSDAGSDSGKLLDYRELTIAADSEVLVRGDCLMSGYLEGDALVLPLDSEGWYHTGDVGRLTDDGKLEIIGRRDNMFVSGGENVHPEAIEGELLKIDGIEEVIVVPVADLTFGERPVAFVRYDTDPTYTLDSLAQMLSDSLPRFMIPIRFHPWPRTLEQAGLKVSRVRLKQIARELSEPST